MTRYLYLRSIRKDMPMYTIEERDGKIYAQINAAQARITSLPDFSDNIFEFLDRNRGKCHILEAYLNSLGREKEFKDLLRPDCLGNLYS